MFKLFLLSFCNSANEFFHFECFIFFLCFIFVSMFLHFVAAFLLCTFVCKTILNFIIYCFLVVYLGNLHVSFGLLFLFLKMLNMSSISVRRGIYGLRCRRWLKWLLWFLSSRLPPSVVTNKPDIVLFYGTFCGQPSSGSSFLSVVRSLLFNHWLLFSKNISNFQIASFFYPRTDVSLKLSLPVHALCSLFHSTPLCESSELLTFAFSSSLRMGLLPSYSRVLRILMLSDLCHCQHASVAASLPLYLQFFCANFSGFYATRGVLATTLPILCVFPNYIQIEIYGLLSISQLYCGSKLQEF